MKKVTLTNNFHNTECNVLVTPDEEGDVELSIHQTRRVYKELCGIKECACWGHTRVEGWDVVTLGIDNERNEVIQLLNL